MPMSEVTAKIIDHARRIMKMRRVNEFEKARQQRIKRLMANEDFMTWVREDVGHAQNRIHAQIMDPKTDAAATARLKSVYYYLETFKESGLLALMERLEADIERRKAQIKKEERLYGIQPE